MTAGGRSGKESTVRVVQFREGEASRLRGAGRGAVPVSVAFVLSALVAGCTGGRSGSGIAAGLPPPAPWDRALVPLESPDVRPEWAEGHVEALSDDGLTVKIKIDRGEVRPGEQAGIFVRTVENPGPHYLKDEVREVRAATAKIVRFEGYALWAEILDESRRAPIAPGDRVIVRVP